MIESKLFSGDNITIASLKYFEIGDVVKYFRETNQMGRMGKVVDRFRKWQKKQTMADNTESLEVGVSEEVNKI